MKKHELKDMLEYSSRQETLIVKKEYDMTIYNLQAEISKTLGHPLRLALLHILKDGEKTVSELVGITGASQSNISQHLSLMRQRQIVKTRKIGSSIYYQVANPKISQACDTMQEVLMEQLNQKQEIVKNYSR